MRYINWCQPAEYIINHVKAFAKPYGGAIAYSKKTGKIIVFDICLLNEPRSSLGPGFFKVLPDRTIKVQTNTKPILIRQFICDEKKYYCGRFVSGAPEG